LINLLTEDEIQEGLFLIDVMERWNMSRVEADEWRRIIAT
jgi:hypothetical protein